MCLRVDPYVFDHVIVLLLVSNFFLLLLFVPYYKSSAIKDIQLIIVFIQSSLSQNSVIKAALFMLIYLIYLFYYL